MVFEKLIRSTGLAVGLMVFEKFIYRAGRGAEALGYGMRSPPARAIPDYVFKDHKPSAMGCEGRLRGLYPF